MVARRPKWRNTIGWEIYPQFCMIMSGEQRREAKVGEHTKLYIYIWLSVELYTWHLLDFVNRCHHTKEKNVKGSRAAESETKQLRLMQQNRVCRLTPEACCAAPHGTPAPRREGRGRQAQGAAVHETQNARFSASYETRNPFFFHLHVL